MRACVCVCVCVPAWVRASGPDFVARVASVGQRVRGGCVCVAVVALWLLFVPSRSRTQHQAASLVLPPLQPRPRTLYIPEGGVIFSVPRVPSQRSPLLLDGSGTSCSASSPSSTALLILRGRSTCLARTPEGAFAEHLTTRTRSVSLFLLVPRKLSSHQDGCLQLMLWSLQEFLLRATAPRQ